MLWTGGRAGTFRCPRRRPVRCGEARTDRGYVMGRRLVVAMLTVVLVTTVAGTAGADRPPRPTPTPTPGAAGVGDPYFPLDGNGGYDVDNYDLAIRYDPATDVLQGMATIRAQATQELSPFNLDLVGLTVRSVKVNGTPATFQPQRRRADRRRRGAACATAPASGSWCATTASRRRSKIRARASPASSTPTTARSSSGSPTWPRRGTRSTITQRCGVVLVRRSPCRPGSRPSPTAC